ncbi:Serine/threonine-protein kinase PknD [Paenibacillus sp. CECT 9249]|uniref:AAA family ATPase n=1 Tax=Paenibacillus sp. CECT 9249 TaxID=2845385 RepID=UPI001E47B554|nr:AAA family ATPase [Paenibacillus sp. CECT 9249]CAH0118227.1 Serine/threonine-protein kinase PknD [Paenibacillus sp. CECT 9249]
MNVQGYEIYHILYEDATTVIGRAYRSKDRFPVLLKLGNIGAHMPIDEDAARYAGDEAAARKRKISGFVAPFAVERSETSYMLVYEDAGGEPLRSILREGRLSMERFLRIAVRLADIVGQLHQEHMLHGDITPENIIVDTGTWTPRLVDFGGTVHMAERTPGARSWQGTMQYMSPEMTGRLGRQADERADLYSLGVTLYEAITGRLPFDASAPIEWVHAHLAKTPVPLDDIVPGVPGAVSGIVMKLLSKNPEDRYQSAFGLQADLERCLERWNEEGAIGDFTLGEADRSGVFRIPADLYGREREMAFIRDKYRWTCLGSTEIIILSGPAGIGKTALVQQIRQLVAGGKGCFAAGKFEQFDRDVPYAPLIAAFRDLVRRILSEDEQAVALWKKRLSGALGTNAAWVVDLIPEIKLLTGDVPPPETLTSAESQHRFQLAFRSLLQAFARKDSPLILFLDDLQWADAASLSMLQSFVKDPGSECLLLIGAFRDDSSNDSQALAPILDQWQQYGVGVHELALTPLTAENLNRIVADTLQSDPDLTLSLTRILFRKTAGNPFFFKQLFKSAYNEGMLTYSKKRKRWEWEEERIQSKEAADDLLQYMIAKVNALPARAVTTLALAACLGSKFDPELLAEVERLPFERLAAELRIAVREGLIVPTEEEANSAYRPERPSDAGPAAAIQRSGPGEQGVSRVWYSFLHDRIQQAAYSLLDEERRSVFHWEVGRRLLERGDASSDPALLFDQAKHLNLGASHMKDDCDRLRLMELNLAAGRKAKSSSAYDAAVEWFRAGTERVREKDWAERFEICFALYLEQMECEYLCGEFGRAEYLGEQLNRRSRNPLDRGAICKVIATQRVNLGQYAEAISAGLQTLKEFGIVVSPKPARYAVVKEMTLARMQLGKRIERLADLPAMENEHVKMAMDIMFTLAAPTFFSNKEVFTVMMSRSVRLSLEYGLCAASSAAFAAFGLMNSFGLGDYKTGYRLGEAGLALADNGRIASIRSKTYVIFGLLTQWLAHVSEGEAYLEKALQFGLESGDYVFASYAMGAHVNSLYTTQKLEDLNRKITHYLQILEETKDEFVIDNFHLFQQWIMALQGKTEHSLSFDTADFRESEFLNRMKGKQFAATTLFQYYTYRVQLHYLYGDYAKAREFAEAARPYSAYATHLPHVAECCYYEALAVAAQYDDAGTSDRKRMMRRLKRNCKQMRKWAEFAPDNHMHRLRLAEAEMARIAGDSRMAMQLYEQAIQAATANEYVPAIAVALERAACFYRDAGVERSAAMYASGAYDAYMAWGASVKANRMIGQFPGIGLFDVPGNAGKFGPSVPLAATPADHEAAAGKAPPVAASAVGTSPVASSVVYRSSRPALPEGETLDLATIVKASQSVSEAMDLSELLHRFMALIIENAGAQRGYLVVENGGRLEISAALDVKEQCGTVAGDVSLETNGGISEAIVRYVFRTGEEIVLANAVQEEMFAHEEAILRHATRSILCVPVPVQGEIGGILYLANDDMAGAFAAARRGVPHMLAVQAVYVTKLLRSFGETSIAVESANRPETLNTAYTEQRERTDGAEREPSSQEQAPAMTDPLTERELDVLNLMAAGLSNQEIADRLVIAVGTVKYHVKNIFAKLHVKRRTMAVAEAKKYNLIQGETRD